MNKAIHSAVVKQQVEELLSRMTIEQKIGQMTQADRMTCSPAEAKAYHLGSILSGAGSCPGENTPADWVKMNDEYWLQSMQQDEQHLGIPIIYGLDAVHGNNNVSGATVFPHNIGLGAADDEELISRIADITAKEILATGVDWAFSPNLAVARDYHWGRTYESFAEEPELVSRYAGKIVKGLQKELGDNSVVACVKHWVGDGGTTHGIDQGNTSLSWEKLRDIHILPYFSAIESGALSVMVSFSSWNGDKCHAHNYLLTEVLKKQMSFNGILLSDMQGIDYLADDFYLAVAQGVNAGIDMFMVPENWKQFIEYLRSHVELGTVGEDRIDDAVRRILRVKFAFGLFDKPRPSERPWSNHQSFGSEEHRQVAREAVAKSLVLLKNQDKILPISKQSKVFVTGKNAHNTGNQCGGFTITWQGTSENDIEGATSVWQAIQQVAPAAKYSIDPEDASIEKHDLAVVVIGENSYAEGWGDIRDGDNVILEAGSMINGQVKVLEACGNTLELASLYPEDLQTIAKVKESGLPVVVILISGRPLLVNYEMELADAFIAAWLPGSEAQGITDVLFGDVDFSGKLSFSWPRQTHPTVNIGDRYYNPLFPHGFGLTYKDNND